MGILDVILYHLFWVSNSKGLLHLRGQPHTVLEKVQGQTKESQINKFLLHN